MNYLGYALLYVWLFWSVFVLVMGIYRAHLNGKLSKVVTALLFPWVVIGYIMDVLANATVAALLFLEPPKEFLVTSRLQRYMRQNQDWRNRMANWICSNLLDPFDPTEKHCI